MSDVDWDAPPPRGYWRNARGDLVREENISPTDRDMDAVTRKIHGFGAALSAQMYRFRLHTLDDVSEFVARVTERYGARRPGGRKGNIQITSFDGRLRVLLAQAEQVAVGPEIHAAQAIVEECIDDWAARSNLKLRALVEQAFRPDATGRLSVTALLRLRRIEIDDPRWRQAQDAIGDALRPAGKAEYVRLYRRADPDGPWEQVPLHLATVTRPADAEGSPAENLERRARAAVEEGRHAGMGEGEIMEVLRAAKRRPAPGAPATVAGAKYAPDCLTTEMRVGTETP